jgi:hypothetical protein
MLIASLFATCLLGDPEPMTDEARLAGTGIGKAALLAFDASAYGDLALPPDLAATPDPDALLEPAWRQPDKSSFSYTYAEAGYSVTHVDVIDRNAEAIYLRGSFEFLKFFHVIGGVEREETSFDDFRVYEFELGGGVHLPILERLDVLGELSYLVNAIDSDNTSSETNEGWMAYAGARFMPLTWDRGGLEIFGGFRYIVLDTLLSDKETAAVEVGARGHFLEHMSVGAKAAFMEDDRMLAIDFRYSF